MLNKKISTIIIIIAIISTSAYSQTSFSLKDCISLAMKNNSKIKNAELEIKASNETKEAAFTKYFPQVSASMIGMYAGDYLMKYDQKGGDLPVYDGNPANLGSATQFAYFPTTSIAMLDKMGAASIMLMQPIYTGGRIVTGNDLAEIGKEISKDKLNIERYSTSAKTEDLYWTIIGLQNKMTTINYFETFLNNLLKDVNVSFQAGLTSRNDVLRVSIKLNELRINKNKLANGINLAKEALCQHIGIKSDLNMILSDTNLTINEPGTYYTDPGKAVKNRFEINMLNNSITASKLQIDLKEGEYMPQIAAGGVLVGYNVMNKSNTNYILFAGISIPISGWWEAKHTIEEQRIRKDIMVNTASETEELLKLQISKTWNNLNESYKQIQLGQDIVDQATENFKENTSNYKAGVTGISDFMESQATLQQAEDQLAEYKSEYQKVLALYMQAVGMYK